MYQAPELAAAERSWSPFTGAADVFAAGAMNLGAVLRDGEGMPMLKVGEGLWEQLEQAASKVTSPQLPKGATQAVCTLLNEHRHMTSGPKRDAMQFTSLEHVVRLIFVNLMEAVEPDPVAACAGVVLERAGLEPASGCHARRREQDSPPRLTPPSAKLAIQQIGRAHV
jgi:hypothetical protein